MILSELVSEVQNVVQDAVWTRDKIVALINEGLMKCATGNIIANKHQLTPPLPELYTIGEITTSSTGSDRCDLPSDFNRELTLVVNSDEEAIQLYDSYHKFLRDIGNKISIGSIRACVRIGQSLIYRDVPAPAETLTVHYYRKPDLLVSDNDEPSCIPEVLQNQILVSYTCARIFEQIEDGIEGQKINTSYYLGRLNAAALELELIVGIDGSANYYDDLMGRID